MTRTDSTGGVGVASNACGPGVVSTNVEIDNIMGSNAIYAVYAAYPNDVRISSLAVAGDDVQVGFGPLLAGVDYALLYRASVTNGSWSEVATMVGAGEAIAALAHAGGAGAYGYYRIESPNGPTNRIWGYARVAKPGNGKLNVVGIPFRTTNQTLNSLMDPLQFSGHYLSPGSADQIMIWDAGTQGYLNLALYDARSFGEQYAYLTGWKAYTNFTGATYLNPVLPPGSAVWLKGSTADDRQATVAGEVMMDAAATNAIKKGLQLVANPFSETIGLSNLHIQAHATGHYLSPGSADQIMVWDAGTQGYLNLALYDVAAYYGPQYAYLTGWRAYTNFAGGPYVNPVFEPGKGFWYRAVSNDFEWVETNPYLDGLGGGTKAVPKTVAAGATAPANRMRKDVPKPAPVRAIRNRLRTPP